MTIQSVYKFGVRIFLTAIKGLNIGDWGAVMKTKLILLISILALSGCATIPLDEETAKFSSATTTAISGLSPIVSGINTDTRRHSFAQVFLDPEEPIGDAPICGSEFDPKSGFPETLPKCFKTDLLRSEDLKPVSGSLSAINGYAKILATLIDSDGLEAAKTQSAALETSLTSLETSLTSANVLGESDPYGGAIGAFASAIVKAQDAQKRSEAIEIVVTEGGPHVQTITEGLSPILKSIAEVRHGYLALSYEEMAIEYSTRSENNTHPSEESRLALLSSVSKLANAQANDPSEKIEPLLKAISRANQAFATDLVANRENGSPELKAALAKLEAAATSLNASMKSFGYPTVEQ